MKLQKLKTLLLMHEKKYECDNIIILQWIRLFHDAHKTITWSHFTSAFFAAAHVLDKH